jgi:UDP-N-acetylglucosamine 2-epimerase (non-hydrolysing)
MKIISVVGARPNFMKVAPIYRAIAQLKIKNEKLKIDPSISSVRAINERRETQEDRSENESQSAKSKAQQTTNYSLLTINHLICHTGQHYDEKMSKVFFEELELPKPDFYLGVGGGSHAEQTAKIMIEFEKVLLNEKPDLVIVVGDVNSTIACSLTAVKLGIKVAHIEAGLRSFDREMPEEINRILTDSISDYLFVTEASGLENLKNEGIDGSKVFFVGHVMIDTLIHYLPIVEEKLKDQSKKSKLDGEKPEKRGEKLEEIQNRTMNYELLTTHYSLPDTNYILVTMHRPSNVDFKEKLEELLKMLNRLAEKRKVVFPIHPRTKNNIEKFDLSIEYSDNLLITEPSGYLDFIGLVKNAEVILTDSGGIQEESTYLGVQCVTVRNTTERPVTVDIGTNHLVGDNFVEAERVVNQILAGKKKVGKIPDLWDGKAAERIVKIIAEELNPTTENHRGLH